MVEGDFTNEGKQYQAGTSLHFKAGGEHCPHTTEDGHKLLVVWTERTANEAADLRDFVIAEGHRSAITHWSLGGVLVA